MVISALVEVQYILSQTGVQACLHLHLVVFTCIIHQKCCKRKWRSMPVSLILICLMLCTKVGWRFMYLKARQEAREPILLTWVTYLSLFFICISVCFFLISVTYVAKFWISPETSDFYIPNLWQYTVTKNVGEPWNIFGVVLFHCQIFSP